jgi:hypothetical protein
MDYLKVLFQHATGELEVATEWLAFLLRIQFLPGSNFGPEIGYPH